MTVEEFRKIPDDAGPVSYELRHGEVVGVPRPKIGQMIIQNRVQDLFRPLAESGSFVASPFPFRALPEHEFRDADVAYISRERWAEADMDDDFYGAPDLVVEVLSPSNTAEEMDDKEQLCLENGTREFWRVNPILRQVKVSTPDGHTITYRCGQEIPLPLFAHAKIAVDAIFA